MEICMCYIALFVLYIILTVWTYTDAQKRGMSGTVWAIVVFLLGFIGLIVYLIVRTTSKPQQQYYSPPPMYEQYPPYAPQQMEPGPGSPQNYGEPTQAQQSDIPFDEQPYIPLDFYRPVNEMNRDELEIHKSQIQAKLLLLSDANSQNKIPRTEYRNILIKLQKRYRGVMKTLEIVNQEPSPPSPIEEPPTTHIPTQPEEQVTDVSPDLSEHMEKVAEWENYGFDVGELKRLAREDGNEFLRQFEVLRKQIEG